MNTRPSPQLKKEQQFIELPDELNQQVLSLKQQAENFYRNHDYESAKGTYSEAQSLLSDHLNSKINSVLHFNTSMCWKCLENKEEQVNSLHKCLEIDTLYRKARVELAKIYMKDDEWISAQLEWTNVNEISELNQTEKEQKELCDKKSIDSALGYLKKGANWVLNKFGMSTDDFKVDKNPDGTMSISMQKGGSGDQSGGAKEE